MLDTGIMLVGVGALLIIVGVIASCFERKDKQKAENKSANPRTSYSASTHSVPRTHSKTDSKRYSIAQEEFEKIVDRCAYKTQRVEHAFVSANAVSLIIGSQSGLTSWHATIFFELSGSADFIGRYEIISDNEQSGVPRIVAKRIKKAIFEHVGII